MYESVRLCSSCAYWDPDGGEEGRREGTCRRFPPVGGTAQGAGAGRVKGIGWPRTREHDWCGEWGPREMPVAVDDEEDRQLRNSSMAQAILTLPEEKRDRLLRSVLSEEELESDCPPDDFYERVQDYLAGQKESESD